MPSWTDYQSERPTREQWDRWLTSPECRGIGLVCGAVSGNLEGFEVEGTAADIVPDLISAIRRLADERGLDGGALIAQFMTYLERSPRLGFHWVVQVVGTPVLGNTVLASRPDPDNGGRPKAIIETRGEGGFFVAAPTPAACHNEEKIREAGLGWQIIAGTPGRVGVLTAEEYRLIHEVARGFDEMPDVRTSGETPQPAVVRPSPVERPPGDLRPGDDFNQRADWADILAPAGWTLVRTRGDGTSEWTRPGKHPREGISATTGYGTRGHDLFFPFTTSTEFTAGRSYDKYGCYALLEHGGNWEAAGRELRRRGYGSNRPQEKYDPMTAVFGQNGQQVGQPNGSSPPPPPSTSPPASTPTSPPPPPPPPVLAFHTITELCARVDAAGPRRWLIRGVWPAVAYGVHAAEPKAGKTWNTLDLAVSVASGTPWLGALAVDTTGPVVVFAGEGGEGNIVRRLRAIAASRHLVLEDLPITICTRVPHLAEGAHLQAMGEHLHAVQPVLVTLDPFYLAAGGANGKDLYAMGELLERPQHLCERAGTSLFVVTHYNRQRDLKGAARMTGAGPAEWGRVLVSASVISRHSAPDTQATSVLTELDVQGGEVPDRTLRIRRSVHAVDADDLDSPLVYAVDAPDGFEMAASTPTDLPPARAKLLAALDAQESPVPGKALIDWIAETHGHGLTRQTWSRELTQLRDAGLADYLENGKEHLWYKIRAQGAIL